MRLKEVRAILYADKRFLIHVNRAEKDGTLISQFAEIPIKQGELFATDQYGNSFLLPENRFDDRYVPVIKIDKAAMARGYQEMSKINLEEANASVHTYNDGLDEFEKNEVINIINKIY